MKISEKMEELEATKGQLPLWNIRQRRLHVGDIMTFRDQAKRFLVLGFEEKFSEYDKVFTATLLELATNKKNTYQFSYSGIAQYHLVVAAT